MQKIDEDTVNWMETQIEFLMNKYEMAGTPLKGGAPIMQLLQLAYERGRSSNTQIKNFDSGMTIKELKDFIKGWPDIDEAGNPCEVWIETGINLSSPVTCAGPLRINKYISADLIFKSNAFKKV